MFSPEKYSQAEKEGFPYIAYNIQNNKDFELVLEKGYRLVTMNLEFARTHAENVRKIREKGYRQCYIRREILLKRRKTQT